MENNDYVDLDIAKKLKELGFNVPCDRGWTECSEYKEPAFDIWNTPNVNETYELYGIMMTQTICPSLYEVQKWLRDNKNISVEPKSINNVYWESNLYDIGSSSKYLGCTNMESSYQEALNEGIKKALDYIS